MVDDTADNQMWDLIAVGERIAAGELSARTVTEAQLGRIAKLDGQLHAYAQVLADTALAQADAADREIAAGLRRGPLHGVPLAVKDLCWIEGVPTAAGTAVHRHFLPPTDSTVVRRLKEAGAVLLGKTQLTEGAYSDYHPSVTPVVNPWNKDYWAGISSSGSAVAVAAGLCYGAIASDTGGSIRWPSAANGVTGLKPSWGRVSRHGVFELAASLDHVGAIARTAADTGAILAAIAGRDDADPTAAPAPLPAPADAALLGAQGLRIGIDPHWNSEGVEPQTRGALAAAAQTFSALGATLVEVVFPDATRIVHDWVSNCAVEAAVAHEAGYAAHKQLYGPILSQVIDAGRAVPGLDYQKILLRRAAFRGRVEALFSDVDLVLTPVQPFAPLSLATVATLGEQPQLIAALQRYTCPFNMSGHPALTFPAGMAQDGLPIGLQLVAANFGEQTLLRAGIAFQSATGWHRRRPPLPDTGAPAVAQGQ
ncbi:amidase [Massilia sp. Root351]|uniref:amidase n=1 Tax=Massilia sp. Root351 TaxID=1736522 RepID=UPI00070AC4D9|nr:amidase [Massilia sp. Root351]KQV84990.1 amidase [Massilia sp. Root351]